MYIIELKDFRANFFLSISLEQGIKKQENNLYSEIYKSLSKGVILGVPNLCYPRYCLT